MKKFIIGILSLALVAAPAWFAWRHFEQRRGPAGAPAAAVQKYYCPMHPTYITDRPGSCPICNMSLVPMPAEDHSMEAVSAEEHAKMLEQTADVPAGYSRVKLSPHAQELLNIEVAVIGRRPFVRSIHTFGRVAAGRKRIDAELHRDDLRYVTRGLRATIGLPSASDRIEGTILSIDRVPKALMQTVAMMIQVADSAELEPRMVVDVMIDVDLGEGTAVPDEAVLPNGSGSIVFVDRGDGVYDPREIETGPQWDGHYRVEKGLAEGDKVVVNAAFLLDSESRIKAAQKEAAHVH